MQFSTLSPEEMASQPPGNSSHAPPGLLSHHHPPLVALPHQTSSNSLLYDPRFFNAPIEVNQNNGNAPSDSASARQSASSAATHPTDIDSDSAGGDIPRLTSTNTPMHRPSWTYPPFHSYSRSGSLAGDMGMPNAPSLPPTALLPPGNNGYPYYFQQHQHHAIPPRIDPNDESNIYSVYNLSPGGSPIIEDGSDSYDEEEASPRPSRYTSSRSRGNSRLSTSSSLSDFGSPNDRHKGTGRKKIEIKPIQYKLKRQITFSKRKTGLLKKVKELTTLTQTEALVILVSETGNPHTFATKKFVDMIRSNDLRQMNQYLDNEEKRGKGKGS